MIKVDVHDNRNKLEAKSEYGQIEELKIEIRKHHVLPGVNILDLAMDVDGEKIMVQTQHQVVQVINGMILSVHLWTVQVSVDNIRVNVK